MDYFCVGRFIIPVSNAQAWKQFGNSVAVPVLKNIARALVETPELQMMVENR